MTKQSLDEKPGLIIRVLDSLEIYALPSPSVLWGLGIIGLFSLLLHFVSPLANGLTFLVWAPVLIFVQKDLYEKDFLVGRIHYVAFMLQITIITALAILFNTRRIVLEGFATLLLIFLIQGMMSKKIVKITYIYRLVLGLLIVATLVPPLTDFATAMVVARLERGKVSSIVIAENTVENFQDKAKLERYKTLAKLKASTSSYDEKYIENPLFARVCTTKYHDNAIYFAGKISDRDNEYLKDKTIGFFWKIFPQPFLDRLKININKKDYEYSMGDLLAQMAIGNPLGAWVTGSLFGQGLAIFGHLFLLIYFGLCFILFGALDLFSKHGKSGIVMISVIGFLNIWPTFIFALSAESINYVITNSIRTPIQAIFLFVVCTKLVKFFTK